MTVGFRADGEVINATAGTSVVVPRPSGTTDGDVLLAFISATGTPSISTPAGWTLIGTQDASTSVRVSAYRKVAASEPASWTWTLGSSQRNGGWVGAYTNVDTTSPIFDSGSNADTTAGTSWATATVDASPHAPLTVSMVATVRTASGAATTFTSLDTERADRSTNAGSGTDIAFAVADGDFVNPDDTHSNSFTSSQSCTAGVLWDVALSPLSIPYDGGRIPYTVEAAWGADPDGDPDLWVWTDITRDVLVDGVTIIKGLQPETTTGVAQPTSVSFGLRNDRGGRGDYTVDNPVSVNWPNVVEDTPIRISVPYGYAPPTERALVFVESWTPEWDVSTRAAIVRVQAYGRLQRIQAADAPIYSVLRRTLSGILPGTTVTAHSYWPVEEESGATQVASAFVQNPGQANSFVSFGSASDCPGSGPLPTLADDAILMFPVAPYAATGRWTLLALMKMPASPVVPTTVALIRVLCSGTAPAWRVDLAPGSPDTLRIRAFGGNDTSLLDAGIAVNEADIYGGWVLVQLSVVQNGANVDYRVGYYTATSGATTTGSLASRTIGAARTIYATAGPDTAGVAFGHFAVIVDADFDPASDPATVAFVALDGKAGDRPVWRFRDLCEEAGLPYSLHQAAGEVVLMGPQQPTTLLGAFEDCAATDQGLIHDGGPGGELVMVTRGSRYNAAVDLTLDVAAKELAPPFLPQYNTRQRVSDSTVTRVGGSSARYADTSVSARAEQVSLSLADDHLPYLVAGFRVHRSSTPGMRYPQIEMNFRRRPDLVARWLTCRIGSRMQVVSLWATHGPNDVDQFIDGYTERISKTSWTVGLHCSPARPFDVAVLQAADDTVFRAELGDSELASGISAVATSMSVASAGALISTSGATYPCDVDVGGEQITVTACSGASSPQTLTVTRGQYARAHDAGTPVVLWRGRGVAL